VKQFYIEEPHSSSAPGRVGAKSNPLPSENRIESAYSPPSKVAPTRLRSLTSPERSDESDKEDGSTDSILTRSELILPAEIGSFEMSSTEQEVVCHFFNISNPSLDDIFFLFHLRSWGLKDAIKIYTDHESRPDAAILGACPRIPQDRGNRANGTGT